MTHRAAPVSKITDLGSPIVEPGIELMDDHPVLPYGVHADLVRLVDYLEEELTGHDGPERRHDEARGCAIQQVRS